MIAAGGGDERVRSSMDLLIGTYTGARSEGVYRARFDPKSGRFSGPELAAGTENPSWLLHDSARARIFAVNERSGRGEVVWFDWDGNALAERARVDSRGGLPCHLGLADGELAVANYEDGVVARWDVTGDAFVLLGGERHSGSSVHPRQRGPHAHAVLAAHDGWLATDLGADAVFLHDAHGCRPWASLPPGSGPRMLVRTPRGLYVLGELDNHLYLLGEDGRIEGRVSTLPAGESPGAAAHLAAHPDGRLFASNRGHDSLAVIDPRAGELRVLDWWPCGGAHPRHFLVTPDGGHLLVANRDSDQVVALSIGADAPAIKGRLDVPAPTCVVALG